MSTAAVDMRKRKCGSYPIDAVFWNPGGLGIIVPLPPIVPFTSFIVPVYTQVAVLGSTVTC